MDESNEYSDVEFDDSDLDMEDPGSAGGSKVKRPPSGRAQQAAGKIKDGQTSNKGNVGFGLGSESLSQGPSEGYNNFKAAFWPLSQTTHDSKKKRDTQWSKADPNGNGQCSLAELDGWIKLHLLDGYPSGEAETIWEQFRPSYIRAFTDARDIGTDKPLGGSKATTDDYVQKNTFRVFVAYLVIYAEMYDAFALIDGGGEGVSEDDDRQISLDELAAGAQKLSGYSLASLQGLDRNTAESVFDDMDTDAKGSVLLVEWCRYLERQEKKLGTQTGRLLALGDDEKEHPQRSEEKSRNSSAAGNRKPSAKASRKSSVTGKRKPSVAPPRKPSVALSELNDDSYSATSQATGPSDRYNKFKAAFWPLAQPTNEEQRKEAWKKADPNGNGQCSLAELDGWIKLHLSDDYPGEAEIIWKQFRPSYIRAFTDARDIGTDKPLRGSKATTDDYVQKNTFRVFVAYLVIYAEMYDAFALIDGGGEGVSEDDDRKISLDELAAGAQKLSGYSLASLQGLDRNTAEAIFDNMDTDAKGSVLLVEWCRYLERQESKLGTQTGRLLALGENEKENSDEQDEVKSRKPSAPKSRLDTAGSQSGRRGNRIKTPVTPMDRDNQTPTFEDEVLFDTGDGFFKSEVDGDLSNSQRRASVLPKQEPRSEEPPVKIASRPPSENTAPAPSENSVPKEPERVREATPKPYDAEDDINTWKERVAQLQAENADLKSKLENSQKERKKKSSRGGPQRVQPASVSIRSSNDSDHLAKSMAMVEHRCHMQEQEIKKLQGMLARGESFQIQDLINEAKDKDRQILVLTKELKTIERMYKINKAQENTKLQDDIRDLNSQIKAYRAAAVATDKLRDNYMRKVNKLREEIKMSKMFKFDPSAAM